MLASLSQPQSESHVVVVYSPQEPGPQAPPHIAATSGRAIDEPPVAAGAAPHAEPTRAAGAPGNTKRSRRAWAPDGDDHLIYQWVKLDGKSQDFAAEWFGISQSTVSRIVERYERWQAHAAEREDGRLDPAERLRAQRWLAFERNEKMLLSCLRLAGEMEGFQDVSKSVTSHPLRHPSQESTMRTEWSVMDRTGMAARFLRLAFRINVEQLKLVESAPAPLPEPLSEDELAEQEALAAEERAQIAAVKERGQREVEATQVSLMDQLAAAQHELAEARREAAAAREELEAVRQSGATPGLPRSADSTCGPATCDTPQANGSRACDAAPSRREGATFMHDVHNLHNESPTKSDANGDEAATCAAPPAQNKFGRTCISADEPLLAKPPS